MDEPRWLKIGWLKAIHADQIRQHGGSPGIRDKGLIESALMRPQNKWAYEKNLDLADLAASYGHGLAKNHGFIDGNKRIAFQAMYVFLGMNGFKIVALESDVVHTIVSLAGGQIGEMQLARWLRKNIESNG